MWNAGARVSICALKFSMKNLHFGNALRKYVFLCFYHMIDALTKASQLSHSAQLITESLFKIN